MSPDTLHGAAAIITDRRGRILMHLRDDTPSIAWPGYWAVPAAASAPGEDEHDTMTRELQEDAGLTVAHLARLFDIEDTYGPGRRLSVFAATWNGDESALPLTTGVKLQFFHPAQLRTLPVPPFVREAITRALPPDSRLWADENEPISEHWT
jgi:8-oxo-dGTP diphosphatase